MINFIEKYKDSKFINKSNNIDTYTSINSITKDEVVLKIFNKEINNEELQSIKSSISILKDMENPNLINVNNMGSFTKENRTYYYIEQEKFNGKSLRDLLELDKLTKVEAVKLLRQVAEGLKEFHFRSINFESINIDNIYINNNGLVKIDILSYLDNKNFLEINEDEFREEEDIFSLGMLLYSLITNNFELKNTKIDQEIQDKDLELIINRCISEKYQGYSDLNKLITDLNSYIEYGGISEGYLEKEYLDNDENYNKVLPTKLIKIVGSLAIILIITVTIINNKNIFNKDNEQQIAMEYSILNENEDEIESDGDLEEDEVVNTVEGSNQVNESTSNSNSNNSNNISNSSGNSNNISNSSGNSNNISNGSGNINNGSNVGNNTNGGVQNPSNGGTTTRPPMYEPEVTPPTVDSGEDDNEEGSDIAPSPEETPDNDNSEESIDDTI